MGVKGILIRDCSNFRGLDDGYIRIAVKSRRKNKKLIKILKEELMK
jgi:threonine-phosphate decarboxylase